MADCIVERQTHIMVSKAKGVTPLYPSDTLYPADDLYPREGELFELTNIVAGSLQLDEMLVDKEPVFGLFFASKFECQVFDPNGENSDLLDGLSDCYIHVYQTENSVRKSVFTGYIDSCKRDKIGTDRTLIAYDPAYWWGSTDVSQWWEDFWETYPDGATIKTIRNSLLGTFKFNAEDVDLPNDNKIVHKMLGLQSGSFAAMMKMLCEISCCYPHFDRDGILRYIIPDIGTHVHTPEIVVPDKVIEPGYTIPAVDEDVYANSTDITEKYEWNNSDFEEYTTNAITGVQFFDSEGQLKYTVGDAENAYGVEKNIFLYDASTEELESIGNTMLDYLKYFSFTPSNVKMIVSDLDLKLGDRVETEQGAFYVFQNSYSGSQLIEQTISAKGSMKLNSTAQPINFDAIIFAEKIARVSQTVEEFYIEYKDVTTGLSSRLTQTAEELSMKVDAQTTSAWIITKINQNGDDDKLVSQVEIGADVIDIQGIVRLLEAEEIRTVLNGDTGDGEPSKYIKYTGNNIEFFEGSYDDNDLKAALSYDGLDYYRNDNFIGRYTTNPFREFTMTNLAVTQSVSGGGIVISTNGTDGININGTSSADESVDLTFLKTFSATKDKKYRLIFKTTNLPDEAALQIVYMSNGVPTLLANCNNANAGRYFTFTAPATGNMQLYMRKGKKEVTYNNSYLTFQLFDIAEESALQYGLDIEIHDGEFWGVSEYNSTGSNNYKLLYSKYDLYSDKARSSKMYDGGRLYSLEKFEFKKYTLFSERSFFIQTAVVQANLGLAAGKMLQFGGDNVSDVMNSTSSDYSNYGNKVKLYCTGSTMYFDMGSDISQGLFFRGYYNNSFWSLFHWNPSSGVNDVYFDTAARGTLKTTLIAFPNRSYDYSDSSLYTGARLTKYYSNAVSMILGSDMDEYQIVTTVNSSSEAPARKFNYYRSSNNFYFYSDVNFRSANLYMNGNTIYGGVYLDGYVNFIGSGNIDIRETRNIYVYSKNGVSGGSGLTYDGRCYGIRVVNGIVLDVWSSPPPDPV